MVEFNYSSWQNGTNWYLTAKALKKASDRIREAYLVAYRNLDIGKSVTAVPTGIRIAVDMTKLDIDDLDQYPIAMLLMGYAMENIFRGIIICRMWLDDPESVNIADFSELRIPVWGSAEKMSIMGHHLRGLLASEAMKKLEFDDELEFDEDEKKMMDIFDMFIVWGGRYATPKEHDPTDSNGLKRLEPIKYPYQSIDSLYLKSMEKLIELCRQQGDRLSE